MALERNAALSSPEARGPRGISSDPRPSVSRPGRTGGLRRRSVRARAAGGSRPLCRRGSGESRPGGARARLAEPRRIGADAAVSLSDRVIARDGRPSELTVVEVVNDNRPFLLDSTLPN